MGRRCCIEGCNSRSSAPEHHGVTYHSFPLDAAIRTVWIQNTRLAADRNITKSVLVCSRHFRRADFQPMKSGKYLLRQRVFPTVFPWGKLESVVAPEEVTTTATPTAVANAAVATTTPATASIPVVLTTPTMDVASRASVEATIAQIMAETAELNAAAGIKTVVAVVAAAPAATVQPAKRTSTEQVVSEEESPTKQARNSTIEPSAKVVAVADTPTSRPAVASPSLPPAGTKFEPVTVFNPGARLEAQDFDGIWHLARVVEVDNDDREVLIKFEKNSKNKSAALGSEEWIPMNSSRLRQKVSLKPTLVFELEEKVMARWSGPRRFPATVKKILANDTYEVLFDDGFVKNVRAMHMNKATLHAVEEVPTTPIAVAASPTPIASSTRTPAPAATPTSTVTPTATPTTASKPKRISPLSKPKRSAPGLRKDWPLLDLDKLDLASLNLPEIPRDGEWTCHWVNDQPIGKEGYLIVGEHKKPTVVVEDWRLPSGWVKHMYQRSNVLGKWDVILVTPNAKRFRSKADLKIYLEELGQVYNPDIYDFSIHRRRAKDINAYAFTADYTPPPPKSKSSDIPIDLQKANVQQTTQATAEALATTLANSSTSQYIETPVVTAMPPIELMTPPTAPKLSANESLVDVVAVETAVPSARPDEDGFAFIGGLKVQIVDNLFRCPQEGCAKNFRKENHLQIHVKHYHQDLIKLLGDCPKMQELAEKRTLGTPDANEPQPKNQIPNQQFFAKLHQQDLQQSRSHRKSTGQATTATTMPTATSSAPATMSSTATTSAPATTAPTSTPTEVASEILTAVVVAETTEDNANNNSTLDATVNASAAATDTSFGNSTADSSMMDMSAASSTADDTKPNDHTTRVIMTSKRSRYSPSKRTPGSRKSNRQRTTRRYLTAAQATAGAPLPTVVTADTVSSSFDFEETRHSFNATPDAKPVELSTAAPNSSSKKRKANAVVVAAPATPLSSLDSPVTADSGSSSFLVPLSEEPVIAAIPQYIKENGELIKIVRMRQEEIINCLCSYGEEDGLMIQCELCLCWQHGICNGIDKESDVPDKYVCYICRNPQRGRESMRYKHDQDWLYEGKLPVASYHNPNPDHVRRFELLKKSHTLTGNLVELKRFMHSLRVKINIANNKGHPKMYLWAKKWDEDEPAKSVDVKQEESDADLTIKVEESSEVDANESSSQAKQLLGEVVSKHENSSANSAPNSPAKKIKSEPSTPVRAPLQLPMPNIPQPEAAIEPVECQHRLLEHIKAQQRRVMDRLNNIELEIDELEKQDNLPDLKDADFSTTKEVVSSFIKELEIMKEIAKINALENLKQSMNNDNNSVVIK